MALDLPMPIDRERSVKLERLYRAINVVILLESGLMLGASYWGLPGLGRQSLLQRMHAQIDDLCASTLGRHRPRQTRSGSGKGGTRFYVVINARREIGKNRVKIADALGRHI